MKNYKYKINGTKYSVEVGDIQGNTVHVEVNGVSYTVELNPQDAVKAVASAPTIKKGAPAPRTASGEEVVTRPQASSTPGAVKSPLPGTIMSFSKNVGDTVALGDTVCVLEAMKMENDIHSDKAGVVKKILVNVGDAVLEGTDLMVVE